MPCCGLQPAARLFCFLFLWHEDACCRAGVLRSACWTLQTACASAHPQCAFLQTGCASGEIRLCLGKKQRGKSAKKMRDTCLPRCIPLFILIYDLCKIGRLVCLLTHHKCPMSAYIAPVMQIFFQYLKLLPPRNSLSSDVGGMSFERMGWKYSMNLSRRKASAYSGHDSGTLLSTGSTNGRSTASS